MKKIENLKLQKKKLIPAPKTKIYLKGVIIHKGNIEHGHYYCFVLINKDWFRFDDLICEKVSEEIVMETSLGLTGNESENVYCLIYEKGRSLYNFNKKEKKEFKKESIKSSLPEYISKFIDHEKLIFKDNLTSFVSELIFNLYNIELNKHKLQMTQTLNLRNKSLRIKTFSIFLEDLGQKGTKIIKRALKKRN